MKKLVAIALAASLCIPAAGFAQTPQTDRQEQSRTSQTTTRQQSNTTQQGHSQTDGRTAAQPSPRTTSTSTSGQGHQTQQNSNSDWHQFTTGEHFSRSRAPNYRRVSHRESNRLSAPPSGYVWVRSNHDALLVRLSNNVVTRIVTGVF